MDNNKIFTPRLIAWELTRQCLSKCIHCRASANCEACQDELSLDECYKVLNNIAQYYKPIIILTGGDPLMRKDIYDIALYGTNKGLRMVMAPCGHYINKEVLLKMKEVGIQRLSFSLDGSNAVTHDNFRGTPGSFDLIMMAMNHAREVDMPFQINTTVTKHNLKELPDILEIAIVEKAVAFHPFLLVPTGNAKSLIDYELSPEEYEETLLWIYNEKKNLKIEFKPTCAPHYYRIFRQEEHKSGRTVTYNTHGLDAMSKGCMGGQSFAFISNTGSIQICGFLDVECGSLRAENYDFNKIWNNSKVFLELRNPKKYHGKCGICDYHKYCGGCRARAYSVDSDYLGEEPYCIYVPHNSSNGGE